MMKNVKLDIAKTGIEISADIEAKAQAANALLHSGKGAGNDFLGWVHLPSSISENEIDAIRKEAAKLRSKADVVVCIGIGGMLIDRVEVLCREQSVRAIALHTSSRMFGLIRFYYGHGYFIHSTDESRGYIRALLVHELEMPGNYDLAPVMNR